MMRIDAVLQRLRRSPLGFEDAQQLIIESLRTSFKLTRVTIMLYNKASNMLESRSAVGVPNIDHRDIRAPVIRTSGISSRAVEARAFIENRPIVVRDRTPDPQYRMRARFPHKTYSREFAVFPLSAKKKKMGILAVSIDDGNPAKLTPRVTGRIAGAAPAIASILQAALPRPPSDRKLVGVLHEIWDKNLLYSVFQPIVDIRKKVIHGYEALLRIAHPLIHGPEQLLACAEKFNQLRDVSFFSHSSALKILPRLEAGQKLFLNLHPKDFIEYENLDVPSNPFHQKDLGRVVFEITERHVLTNPSRLLSLIRFFKSFGVGIAMDDVGSGYSSLEALTNLELDYIKMDMSLIRNIHRSDKKQKLVKTLLYYADQTGCRCIAEGVETKDEFDTLTGLGCRFIQGFYLAMPQREILDNCRMRKRLEMD